MKPDEARTLFAAGRVARLATVGADGHPRVLPVCFAVVGDRIVSAVDAKPKRTLALRRLADVAATGRASLVVDHYDDADWSALWWARADGSARVVPAGTTEHASVVAALAARYAQYRAQPPAGPAIVVEVERWSGWRG